MTIVNLLQLSTTIENDLNKIEPRRTATRQTIKHDIISFTS